ncbi:MAG: PaaI family thioesterase [Acidimicrobiales bacterium]
MNAGERTEQGGGTAEAEAVLTARRGAAEAVRRLGSAISAGNLDHALAERIAAAVGELAALAERAPRRDKQAEHSLSARYQAIVEGRLPDPTPDGAPIDFDVHSIVGGRLNPFGLGAAHRREGDEAVTRVRFGPSFEGPPGRAHGGAVALVMDEATATLLPMLGRFGFTGSIAVKLVAPAPLGVEVTFRSRLVGEEGRKLFVRCVASGPDGVFAEADAVYVQVDPSTIPWIQAARRPTGPTDRRVE